MSELVYFSGAFIAVIIFAIMMARFSRDDKTTGIPEYVLLAILSIVAGMAWPVTLVVGAVAGLIAFFRGDFNIKLPTIEIKAD